MSCPGLHCPGCSEGQSLGIVAAAVAALYMLDQTVQWVAERIWWIGSTVAVCFILATAAGMWLERWSDRRAAEWGAARGILSRADVILPPARAPDAIPAAAVPAAIEQHVHLHYHAAPGAEVTTSSPWPTGDGRPASH